MHAFPWSGPGMDTRAIDIAHGCHLSMTSIKVDAVADVESLTSTDPAVGLAAVRALQQLQERLEAIQVANAREQGWSWQAIAGALGVSRQAVHQKYNRRS
jgi:DNA-directed RNA polymerase specialized sigma24 family protein